MKYFTNDISRVSLVNVFAQNSNEKLIIKQIMRVGFVSIAILLTTLQLLLALPVRSQKINSVVIKLELNNETMLSALKKIEQQTQFRFVYRKGDLSGLSAKGLNESSYTVEQALNILLSNTGLTYKQVNNNVLITVDDEQFSVQKANSNLSERDVPVRGKVTDVNGESLPGVSVRVKGANIGTTTDLDGNFVLNVPENNPTLVFTYVGYVTMEIAFDGQTSLNIKLESANTALNEVVVTALGISRASKSLTYSAQNINSDQINKATGVNVVNALQGKVAGLTITRNTNGVGGGSNILLRGNRSITGNNAPLYVTDGVPGGIGFEDGDNIESITVLKGAAAAALYGSAGQNGVILITTKKGKAGVTSVEFNGGLILDKANIYHELQYEYAQGDAGLFVNSSEHSFGPKMTGQPVTLWNGSTVALAGQPDMFEDFFRTGATYNNSININMGNDKTQTYFSYGNIRAQGIMLNNDLTRHNVNLRVSNNISKKLSIDAKLTYNNEKVDNSPASFAITSIYRTPVSIPTDEMKKYEYIDASGNPRQSYWKPGSSIIGNPYFYMYKNLNYDEIHRVVGLLSAKYDFNQALSLQVRGNVNQSFSNSDTRIYQDSYHSLVGSTYTAGNSRSTNSNVDALLTYKHDLSKDFNLSGHVGAYMQGSRNTGFSANANGLNKQDFFYLSNAKAPQVTNTFSQSPLIQSLYTAATVSFRDFLYLDVTGRNDWSSALPKGEESVFYPSVGLTAIVSDIVKLPSWISYGKVRVSSANAGNGGNAYFGKEYYTLGVGGLISTPTIQSFDNYKPELTTSFEAGLDWRFFNNRLGLDLTYYRTSTKNQLLLIGAPSASTYNQRYINAGLIENNGIELLLNTTPIKAGKFSWDAMFNFSKNNNNVVSITEEMKSVIIQDDDIITTKVEEGRSFGELYVKGWQRDAQGRKLVDNMGRPLLTPGKTVYAGNFNPDFMAGLTNSFNYKNVSFSFQIDHRNGGYIVGGTQPLLDADGHSKRSLEGREGGLIIDAYLADGTKNTKSITSQAYFSAIGDRKPTGEEYNYSATNTRLREVTLDYTLPSSLLSKSKYIKGAKISLIGRNLFFIDKDAPFDPDISRGRGGTEYTALPFTRSFGLNLRASF